MVLDLEELDESAGPADFIDFVVTLRQHSLIPVGIQGGTTAQQNAAFEAGLTIMPTGRPSREPEREFQRPAPGRAPTDPLPPRTPSPIGEAPPAPDFQKTTMIITEPVRSGPSDLRRARRDLIVMGPVSAGAELLADGNIHVYSSLRGRAGRAFQATPTPASSAIAWKPNWCRSPVCTGSARTSTRRCSRSRYTYIWTTDIFAWTRCHEPQQS